MLLFHCSTLFLGLLLFILVPFFGSLLFIHVDSVFMGCCVKKWSSENEKTGLQSQDQESLRHGKLTSDPKIGSEDFSNLIRSDDQCNQSEVAMSANEMGSDLEKQILHLENNTD